VAGASIGMGFTILTAAALGFLGLGLCQRAGLVRLGHVALDGTKIRANASKHKAMRRCGRGRAELEDGREMRALLFLAVPDPWGMKRRAKCPRSVVL
jgi:hypothetical protein